MTKPASAHLRLFTETTSVVEHPEPTTADRLEELCAAFSAATGVALEPARRPDPRPLADREPWRVRLAAPTAAPFAPPPTDELYARARRLADALGEVLAELEQTREALRRREAELATGIPLVAEVGADRHLADRLESVLRAAAEAVGARAAGLYLLDSGTTELKLRTGWNLPADRLLQPPRPLHAAMADLEALAGHAVALEDATGYAHWHLPEAVGAAVCVPVSSATTPLGTLWVFADEARPFTDQEVNLVEICAGRIAADLERELLLAEAQDVGRLRRDRAAAEQCRAAHTPQVAPLVDGWEIAGCLGANDADASEFFDWQADADGRLFAAIGRVEERSFAAVLQAETVRSAWRAHARHEAEPERLLERVNADLWSAAAEPRAAHVLTLATDLRGDFRWASAGEAGLLFVPQSGELRLVDAAGLPLGIDDETFFPPGRLPAAYGDVFVAAADRRALDALREWLGADRPERRALRHSRDWVQALGARLSETFGRGETNDHRRPALIVVRRTR